MVQSRMRSEQDNQKERREESTRTENSTRKTSKGKNDISRDQPITKSSGVERPASLETHVDLFHSRVDLAEMEYQVMDGDIMT